MVSEPIGNPSIPVDSARDTTLRDALGRIERLYLEPGRIDARRMLQSARRAMGLAETSDGPGPASSPDGAHAPPPSDGRDAGWLERALADPLEATLRGAIDRRAGRARVLGAALSTLDPYCRAVVGSERRSLHARFDGRRAGAGLRLGRREGRIRVLEVLPRSGARAAGLRAGDVLLEVDGAPVRDATVSQVVGRLRGETGSIVRLRVERVAREIEIVRGGYELPSVTALDAGNGVWALRVSVLARTTAGQLDRHLASPAARRARGLIVDLRGNRGGSMLAAAAVADRFVRAGTLLEALDRLGRPVEGLRSCVRASGTARIDTPLLVLVDGRTASSAELLAAALTFSGRGLLAGTRTFGKNYVQKMIRYDDEDLTLKISAAYLGTAGRRLPAEGLAPALVCEDPSAARDLLLRRYGASDSPGPRSSTESRSR